jgi:hypothetical protein
MSLGGILAKQHVPTMMQCQTGSLIPSKYAIAGRTDMNTVPLTLEREERLKLASLPPFSPSSVRRQDNGHGKYTADVQVYEPNETCLTVCVLDLKFNLHVRNII